MPNSHYLRIKVEEPGKGFGVTNEGFRGIGVEKGKEYVFSVMARGAGRAPAALRVEVLDAEGRVIGQAKVSGFSPQWKRYAATLRATGTEGKARLNVLVEGAGALDVDLDLTLPRRDRGSNRANGLRPDLVKLLKEMQPGLPALPRRLHRRGAPPRTALPVEDDRRRSHDDRRLIVNRWNTEFRHRPDARLLPVVRPRLLRILPAQRGHRGRAAPDPELRHGLPVQLRTSWSPLEDLDHYIQDALDLIEFANGPATSRWGARPRRRWVTPRPSISRCSASATSSGGRSTSSATRRSPKCSKPKHPDITLVTSSGPFPDGKEFDFLWAQMRELKADIVDEHYYMAGPMVPRQRRPLRRLSAHGAEGLRGRVRRAVGRHRQPRQPEQLGDALSPKPPSSPALNATPTSSGCPLTRRSSATWRRGSGRRT